MLHPSVTRFSDERIGMNCLYVYPRLDSLPYPAILDFPNPVIVPNVLKGVAGLRVASIDFFKKPREQDEDNLLNALAEYAADMIVVWGGLGNFRHMELIYRCAKQYKPDIITIACGVIVTGDPKAAMTALRHVDYGIVGDAEEPLSELCGALVDGAAKEQIMSIHGLIAGETGREGYVITQRRAASKEWVGIPWADYSSCSLYETNLSKRLQILTSRGCPYRCKFCPTAMYSGYKERPLDDLFAEIQHFLDYTGKRASEVILSFVSEIMSVSKKRIHEICEGVEKLGFVNWNCFLRVNQIDYETAAILKRSRCAVVKPGLESACDNTLKNMGKGISVQDIEQALTILNEFGIGYNGHFLLGHMGETFEDAMETIRWIDEHPEFCVDLLPVNCLPGSSAYNYALEKGLIADPVEYLISGKTSLNISAMSDAEYGRLMHIKTVSYLERAEAGGKFAPLSKVISYDRNTMTTTGYCRNCGQALSFTVNAQSGRCCTHCRNCGVHQYLSNPKLLGKINNGKSAYSGTGFHNSIQQLLNIGGEIVFWGIGLYFKEHISVQTVELPGVRLVDSNVRGYYGGKRIELPTAIPSNMPSRIVISAYPGSAAASGIRTAALQFVSADRILELGSLLDKNALNAQLQQQNMRN